jgi:hypothetical protein
MRTDPDAEAVMIWLPFGKTAIATSFATMSTSQEPRWTLVEAVKHALKVMGDHSKIPWIKACLSGCNPQLLDVECGDGCSAAR